MARRGPRPLDRFPVTEVPIERLWEVTESIHAQWREAMGRVTELRLAQQTLVVELYRRGWSQTAIAERLGEKQSDVWRMLHGKKD